VAFSGHTLKSTHQLSEIIIHYHKVLQKGMTVITSQPSKTKKK